MRGIPQTKDLNPARPGIEDGFYISMPLMSKLDLSLNTNNWSYSDLIRRGTGPLSDSLVMDLNHFTSALGNRNFINESAGLTFLEAGLKKGRNFFSFSLSDKEYSEFYFHKGLVNLINYGNYPYLGKTFNSGTFGLNAQHYRELAFTYSREIDKKLSIGATAKLLFGMGVVHTNGLKLIASAPQTGDALDVIAKGKIDISAPVSFSYSAQSDLIKNVYDNFHTGSYFNNYNNPGLAFDLGIAYQLTKKWEFSASLVDLGLIAWSTNTTRFNEQGHYLYRGVNLNVLPDNLESNIHQIRDTIQSTYRLNHSEKGFTTFLPLKLYLGGEYLLNDKVTLAGLARIRASGNTIHTSLTASANLMVWNGFSFSGSYSVMESTFDNLGAGIGFRGGPFQIYAVSDNIFSPFHPSTARNMNLRLGINFIFNDREKEDQIKKPRKNKKECACPY